MSDDDTSGEDTSGEDVPPKRDDPQQAKEELFEAIDHFKNAASILFQRATTDPAVKNARKEAERVAKKLGDAAEPLAKQLTDELGRLTKDVMKAVDGAKRKPTQPPPSDEEE